MEKRSPTYDLDAIKECIITPDQLEITKTAFSTAQELGFQRRDIVDTIQTINRTHFIKSMTSHNNHRLWQDVYYVPHSDIGMLYIKFTAGVVTSFMVLSFKAKEES